MPSHVAWIRWVAVGLCCLSASGAEPTLRLATFDIDATPPRGQMMAYDAAEGTWDMNLRARGIVLLGSGQPIVLCAVDWIGIANGGNQAFRAALARAADTVPERVALHTLHQHDAPRCDFDAETLFREAGLETGMNDSPFHRGVLTNLAEAVTRSLPHAQPVTHVGTGRARVEKVASNRRILGPDGKVRAMRFTACRDPQLRAEPEGTIDPEVSLVSFWNGDAPLAVLSYYATHPQSYYRTKLPNPDFPGMARFFRQLEVPEALHVHFTGAGGNIGAGKYNDGSPGNRVVLARRLAEGMRKAWEATEKTVVTAEDIGWGAEAVALPQAPHLDLKKMEAQYAAREGNFFMRGGPGKLVWLRRCAAGDTIDITCLRVGPARILHLPGELFVEYQLAAKRMRPDRFVALAAYGDYGTGYIGTEKAYGEGGYETSPGASNVAPAVEGVLLQAIQQLLKD